MLYALLDSPETFEPLLNHAVWTEAFDWLRTMPSGIPEGTHPIRGEHMFVNVHSYQTRAREKCRYENHRKYVDLQYGIAGGEIIEAHSRGVLRELDPYDAAKDVEHYIAPAIGNVHVRLVPRSFAIFYPGDAHMPKVSDGINSTINKLVIKIDLQLLK